MENNIFTGFTIALTVLFVLFTLFAVIKSRYKRFTNREFVLLFRAGKLKSQGYGGAYFLLPLIDELIVTINNCTITSSTSR